MPAITIQQRTAHIFELAKTGDKASLLSAIEEAAQSWPEHNWPDLFKAISFIEDSQLLKQLAHALAVSPSPAIRRFVAEGLSAWPLYEDQNLNLLRWLATDRDQSVARAAALSIGERSNTDPKAWREIEELAHNSTQKSRVAAARACSRAKSPKALQFLQNLAADNIEEVRAIAAESWHYALTTSREKAWPVFLEMAGSEIWPKRHTAALTLLASASELNSEDIKLLNQFLEDTESEVRAAALRILAEMPGQLSLAAQQIILQWVNGEKDPFDLKEREAAIPGLARMSRWQASKNLKSIERLAKDNNLRIAEAAAQVIGQLAHEFPEWAFSIIAGISSATDEFASSLKRLACARGLTLAEPPYNSLTLNLVERFLRDSDGEVRAEAARCLRRFFSQLPDQVMELLSRQVKLGGDLTNGKIRQTIAEALGEIATILPARALPLLERLATDLNDNVRMATAEAFKKAAQVEPEKAMFSLIQLAEDQSVEKKQTAAIALGELALTQYPDKVLQTLKRLAAERDANIRDAAAFSLGQIAHRFPHQVIPMLERLLQNRKSQSVLKLTQGLLSQSHVISAPLVPFLEKLANEQSLEIQQTAAQMIINLARWAPEKALEISSRWNQEKNHALRAARLNVLGVAAFCKHPAATETLQALSKSEDEESRADAARVCGELAFVLKKDLRAFLYQATDSNTEKDWVVRESAGLALGARGWLRPKNVIRSLNFLMNDIELAPAFAAQAVLNSFRLREHFAADNAESGEMAASDPSKASRLARHQQSRLGSYLISVLTPPDGLEKQNGGFCVQSLPGEFAFPATIDLLLDDLDIKDSRSSSSASLPSLSEQTPTQPKQRIFKKVFTWLSRKLFGDEVELVFLKTSAEAKEQPVSSDSQSIPIAADKSDLRKRLNKVIGQYSDKGSYSLKDIERLMQVLPRPLVFYALYRNAKSTSTRRIARLGYDLASLVEKVETADLLKGTTQTDLRRQLPNALQDFLNRCSRLEDGEKHIYVERFSWMREALMVTSLEQIPLLLARPIQELATPNKNTGWLERCRLALLEATKSLKELRANTPADTKTFLLLRCIISLEEAHRTVSGEAPEPDRTILLQAVTAWRELISDEAKRSQSSAKLEISIPQRVPANDHVELTVKILNHGPTSVANLQLQVSGEGFNFLVETNSFLSLPSLAAGQSHTFTVTGKAWTPAFRVACLLHYDEPRKLGQLLQHTADVTTELPAEQEQWANIRNPFVAGVPLKPGLHDHLFVGRTDIFDFLHQQLINAETPRPVVLHGRRRMGKSSVLMWLPTRLPAEYHAAYVDLQGVSIAKGSAQHLQYVANAILLSFPGYGYNPAMLDLKFFEANAALHFEQVVMPEVKRLLNGKKLVVTFDEFQALEEQINNGNLEIGFTSFLRSWVMRGDACFVFVGTRAAQDFDHKVWLGLFMLAIAKEIDLLSPEESLQVMQSPLRNSNVEFDQPSLDHLKWLTGYHPYFVQRLCSEVVDELNRRRQKLVTVSTVDAAAKQLIEGAALQLRFLWEEMEDEQRAVIGSIYEQLSSQLNDDKQCRIEDVWSWMTRVNPKVPRSDFQRIISSLQKRGSVKDDNGALRFSLGLLPAFLAAYIPARETRERIFKLW